LVGLVAAVTVSANADWHKNRRELYAELAARWVHSSLDDDLIKSVGPGSGVEVRNRQ
jgi:hypothetical protein